MVSICILLTREIERKKKPPANLHYDVAHIRTSYQINLRQ
jgi:hypothetical protein